MTRTLWVTNDLPPRAGGIEQFLGNLLARLEPDQTRVLASHVPGDAEHDRGVAYDVHRIGRRPLLPTPALLRRLRAHIEAFQPDVVVFGAAWPLAELARHVDRPVLALTHGHEAGIVRVGGGPVVRHALHGVTTVTAISAFTRHALEPWLPAATRLRHLPPGVDTDTFTPDNDTSHVRRRLGISPDAPLVVCIGRLVRRKGQDVLVESWLDVLARVSDAMLLIAGAGPLQRHLVRRVGELGLRDRVVVSGRVDWHELADYYRAADVFAMPCRTRLGGLDVEGLGIVFLEAQACGVPVVVGRSGGAPEACAPDRTGLLVDGADPRQVGRAVADLLEDPQRRAAMGAAGREFVSERYAWPVICARFAEILQETTATRTAR